jgi:hypothetical protein
MLQHHESSPRLWTPRRRSSPLVERARCSPFGGFGFGARCTKKFAPAELIDPATLAMSGYWRGSYTSPTWNGTASLGGSGSESLTVNSGTVPAGPAQNGFTSADFTSGYLQNASIVTFVGTSTVWTGFALVQPDDVTTLAQIAGDTGGGSAALVVTSDTAVLKDFDAGANPFTAVTSVVTTIWTMLFFGWDGTHIWVRNGALTRSKTAVANQLHGASALRVGSRGVDQYNGRIMELGYSKTSFTDATIDGIRRYASARYDISV